MKENNDRTVCNMKVPRGIYFAFLGVVLIFASLSELDVLPTAYLALNAQSAYAMNMLCVLLTLGGTFVSLRLFAMNKVKQNIKKNHSCIIEWNIIRTLILGVCMIINIMAYYALCNDTTPLYCFLITITGFVFCWPKMDEVASK